MQEHRYSFEIDASPEEIWSVMHTRPDHPEGFVGMGEYGPFVYSVTIILWGFFASLIMLAGAEWAARRPITEINAIPPLR